MLTCPESWPTMQKPIRFNCARVQKVDHVLTLIKQTGLWGSKELCCAQCECSILTLPPAVPREWKPTWSAYTSWWRRNSSTAAWGLLSTGSCSSPSASFIASCWKGRSFYSWAGTLSTASITLTLRSARTVLFLNRAEIESNPVMTCSTKQRWQSSSYVWNRIVFCIHLVTFLLLYFPPQILVAIFWLSCLTSAWPRAPPGEWESPESLPEWVWADPVGCAEVPHRWSQLRRSCDRWLGPTCSDYIHQWLLLWCCHKPALIQVRHWRTHKHAHTRLLLYYC